MSVSPPPPTRTRPGTRRQPREGPDWESRPPPCGAQDSAPAKRATARAQCVFSKKLTFHFSQPERSTQPRPPLGAPLCRARDTRCLHSPPFKV